jgi:hypothetical protein
MTDRDRIFERAFGIHEITLDDRICRLELTELRIVRVAKQVLSDCRQGLNGGEDDENIINNQKENISFSALVNEQGIGFTRSALNTTSLEFGRTMPGSTRRRNSMRLS